MAQNRRSKSASDKSGTVGWLKIGVSNFKNVTIFVIKRGTWGILEN